VTDANADTPAPADESATAVSAADAARLAAAIKHWG